MFQISFRLFHFSLGEICIQFSWHFPPKITRVSIAGFNLEEACYVSRICIKNVSRSRLTFPLFVKEAHIFRLHSYVTELNQPNWFWKCSFVKLDDSCHCYLKCGLAEPQSYPKLVLSEVQAIPRGYLPQKPPKVMWLFAWWHVKDYLLL